MDLKSQVASLSTAYDLNYALRNSRTIDILLTTLRVYET